jgi:hypothetical protein
MAEHGSRIIAALERAWAAIQDQHPDVRGVVGFAGKDFEAFLTGHLGAHLIRPDRIIDTLKGQLTLEAHGGRTLAGVYARAAARCSPSPQRSGTTTASAHPSNDPSPRATTKDQYNSVI